jgi:hypothetical protein
MVLTIMLAMVFSFAGCSKEHPKPIEETVMEKPTSASITDSVPIGELLAIVNTALERDGGGNVVFKIDEADVYELPPPDNEVLYVFNKADCEIVLFASYETGNFLQAYFRVELDSEAAEEYMLSYAGVFLMALEPNEYVQMLDGIVAQFNEMVASASEDEIGDEYFDEEEYLRALVNEEGLISYGEHWKMTYRMDMVNIQPQ